MSKKGVLKHQEHDFAATVGAASGIHHKHPSRFYLTWRIVNENEVKEITSPNPIQSQPDHNGVIAFSTELKAQLKLVYNKETDSYTKKKSMLCLNYINDSASTEPKLAGFVTIDLASIASGALTSGFGEYSLERSVFKEGRITVKFSSRKIREENLHSANWEEPSKLKGMKEVNIDSLLNSESGSKSNHSEKQRFSSKKSLPRASKENSDLSCRKVCTESNDLFKECPAEHELLQTELQQVKNQAQDLRDCICFLQKQNSRLSLDRENEKGVATPSKRMKSLEEELLEMEELRDEVNALQNNRLDYTIRESRFKTVMEENNYILNQLEKVSIQLVTREKEIKILRSQYDHLKRKEKKKAKAEVVPPDFKHHIHELSAEVMRLHGELANHRETEIESQEIKRQKEKIEKELLQTKTKYESSNVEVETLKSLVSELRSQPQKAASNHIDQNSLLTVKQLIQQMKMDQRATSELIQFLKPKNKQNPSEGGNYSRSNSLSVSLSNEKIKEVALELQKLKSMSTQGMSSESKKRFLQGLKGIDSKLTEVIMIE